MNEYLKKSSLIAAGSFNLVLGSCLLLFPGWIAYYGGLSDVFSLFSIQATGLLIDCFGLLFLIASRAPLKFWPLVLAGFISKLIGPICLVSFIGLADVPSRLLWVLVPNDLIWWLPLWYILFDAFEIKRQNEENLNYLHEANVDLQSFPHRTHHGHTLAQLSQHTPVLLVFLRHFGCTFCRETLDNLTKEYQKIADKGTKIVLVHMVNDDLASRELLKFHAQSIDHVSDPNKELYHAFGLHTARVNQFLGLKFWLRVLHAGIIKGHLIGPKKGDAYQMPGVFLLQKGGVVRAYRHHTAADTPNYQYLATPLANECISIAR